MKERKRTEHKEREDDKRGKGQNKGKTKEAKIFEIFSEFMLDAIFLAVV